MSDDQDIISQTTIPFNWAEENSSEPITVIELIRAFYQLNIFRQPGVNCNEGLFFHEPGIEIPPLAEHVNITRFGDTFNWSFDLPEQMEERLSATTLSTTMTRHEINRLRHEFVSEALHLGTTDSTFDSVFLPIDDGMDKLTPDFLVNDEYGVVHCIEMATTRSTEDYQLKKIADTKLFKYNNALFLRTKERKATMNVIIVNQHGVHSNFQLNQKLVDDLYIRYKITIALENVGKEKGFDIFLDREDEELNKIALDIEDQLSQISFDHTTLDDGLLISTEFIEAVLGPVNHQKVTEAFHTSFEATVIPKRVLKQGVEEKTNYLTEQKNKIQKLVKDYESDKSRRTTRCKPVLNLPKVLPAVTNPSTKVRFVSVGSGDTNNELIQIWKTALNQVNSSEAWQEKEIKELEREALESRQDKLKDLAAIRKKRMAIRARVKIDIKPGGRWEKYLAKDGIKAKSTKTESWRKQRKAEQSKTLSFLTDCGDISDYVNGSELFSILSSRQPDHLDLEEKLIHEANEMNKNKSEGLDVLKDWKNTLLFRYSEFISELSAELTVTLRQFVGKREFLLKKLRNYSCYILLAPAGKKNPIGWSLLVPKQEGCVEMKEFIGRPMLETSSCWISTFVTTMPDKLENMWNMKSTMLSLISFLGYFFNLNTLDVGICVNTLGFKESLNLLLAIRMEDKAETEETVTLTRYMYMEVMKTHSVLVKPDPFKMLEKFSIAPRSRLNLFLQKRIIEAFLMMATVPPCRTRENDYSADAESTDPLPTDNWSNLINYLDLNPVTSATKCLSLFYTGYLKNKNAVSQGNTNWLLLEKTINEELKIDWSNVDGYSGNADTSRIPKSHQFNLECIKAGVEVLEKRLHSTYGENWRESIGKKVLTNLSRENSFRLATLKASSLTRDEDVMKPINKLNNYPVKRRKVLEAIADNVKNFGINPFRKLRTFISKRLSGSKKARADLFKKQQHGGLREIYVLDETTRVLQLFVEVCSRTICKEFEEESLTNPKRKLPIINNHYNKTRKYARATGRYCINSNSSMDKTKWNQGFMIRAIAAPLFRLLPQKFHGALQTILNMWIGKDIKIPPEVIELLLRDVRLSSKSYDRLRMEFYGVMEHTEKTRPITRSKFNSYISIKSGFMQGILHYTSSLLHLAFLSLSKSLLYKIINKTFDGASSLISFACSSDDSAMMISLFFKKNSKFFSVDLINQSDQLERLLHTIEEFSKFFCMRPSIKSTVAMLDSVEFNSEFIFNNTLAVPVLKFVIAANNCLPYESLIDKLNGSYNLISALYSAGFPSFNTHLCQIAQLLLHYKSLGLGLSPLDQEVFIKILKLKDPNYGFFPLDNHLCPGVMGLPFMLYRVYKNTGVLPISPKSLKKETIVSLESGVPSESLQISHGDRRKQKKLLLGLQQVTEGGSMKIVQPSDSEKFATQLDNCMKHVKDEVNSNFELFYRAAETDAELLIKIKLKALMPGVAKSLNSGNVHIQNVSASLYSSHTACMTLNAERFSGSELSRDNPNKIITKKTSVKVSLLKAIVKREQELEQINLSESQTKVLEASCFPLLKRYEEFDEIADSFNEAVEQRVARFRSQKNKLDIIPHKSKLPLSLLETVKVIWFGHKNPTSKTVLERCFSVYQGLFNWLFRSHNETLENSPFSTPTEMFSFLNSINDGGRSIIITCPSIPYSGFRAQISHLIKKNYKQSTILRRPLETHIRSESNKQMKDKLSLSLFITDPDLLERTVKQILSSKEWDDLSGVGLMELNKQEQILHFLKLHYRLSPEEFRETLSDYMNNCSTLYQLMYTMEQRKVTDKDGKVSWIGPGEVIVKIGKDMIIYRLMDDNVTEIRSSSIISITRNLKSIKDSMTELRVRPSMIRHPGFQVIGKYNGEKVVSNSSIGCPIKIDSTIENRYLRIADHKIVIDNGKISLLYKAAQNRWVRLMNYYPAKEGIDVSRVKPPTDDCWDAWLQISSWKGESALATIDQLKQTVDRIPESKENWRDRRSGKEKKEMEKYKIALTNYKTFLSSTLRTRIVNLKSQRLYIDECLSTIGEFVENEEEDELGEDFFNDLIMEGLDNEDDCYNNLVGAITKKEEPISDIGNLEEEISSDIDELLLTMSETADPGLKALAQILTPAVEDNPLSSVLYRKITTEYTKVAEGIIAGPKQLFATHPLWDHLIATLDKLDSRLISNMMDGLVSAYDPSSTKLLMWLLGIKEKNMIIKGVDLSRGVRDERISRIQKYLDSMHSDGSDSDNS